MIPARQPVSLAIDTDSLPWISLGPGVSFKPLRFLAGTDGGRILLLRVDPGALVTKHRHTGEVHAFNLAGHREILETGEVIGPGGYVHEPAGNIDSWRTVGDVPVIVHITAYGAMDHLDAQREPLARDTDSSLRQTYLRYCVEHGLAPVALGGSVE